MHQIRRSSWQHSPSPLLSSTARQSFFSVLGSSESSTMRVSPAGRHCSSPQREGQFTITAHTTKLLRSSGRQELSSSTARPLSRIPGRRTARQQEGSRMRRAATSSSRSAAARCLTHQSRSPSWPQTRSTISGTSSSAAPGRDRSRPMIRSPLSPSRPPRAPAPR